MTVRVPVSPTVLNWIAELSGQDRAELTEKFPRWESWLAGRTEPTLRQAQDLSRMSGVPFGYLLLSEPPVLDLPVPDFREGFVPDLQEPSPDLLSVVHQSIRRQDWYREYAEELGLPEVEWVGAGEDATPSEAAAQMRSALNYEVDDREGSWTAARKQLLRAFEAGGGLTVATSMVENNTHRLLDPDEFRGFTLVDPLAPLVFINTNQTLNGQLFTIAHEFAHIWLGRGGVSLEDPQREPQGQVERWCNAVASEFLVPNRELRQAHGAREGLELTGLLDELAVVFRCGTLVILQALRRAGLRRFDDFAADYAQEESRLRELAPQRSGGGDFHASQPFRIGERFSRAVISDALSGRTSMTEALRLTSLKSLSSLDTYAERLGVA